MKQLLLALLIIAAVGCQTKPEADKQDWLTLYIVNGKDTSYCNGTTRGIGNILSIYSGTFYGYHYDSTLKANIVYYSRSKAVADTVFIHDTITIRQSDDAVSMGKTLHFKIIEYYTKKGYFPGNRKVVIIDSTPAEKRPRRIPL